jgi:hypothetical protein
MIVLGHNYKEDTKSLRSFIMKVFEVHGHSIIKFFLYNLCVEYPVQILYVLIFSNLTGDRLARLIQEILHFFSCNSLPNSHALETFCSPTQ